jgi:hypothetical protein
VSNKKIGLLYKILSIILKPVPTPPEGTGSANEGLFANTI